MDGLRQAVSSDAYDGLPETRAGCGHCHTFDRAAECKERGCEGGCDTCKEMFAARAALYGELWEVMRKGVTFRSGALNRLVRDVQADLPSTRDLAQFREWWHVLAALRYMRNPESD